MSTPGAILNTVRRIDDNQTILKRKESGFKVEIKDGRNWWEGNAYKSLESSFIEIEKETSKIYNGINNLKSELKRLSSDVQRAEEEKRRKKMEMQKNGKD
ncbi:UNVERIFIED_CONTAM: hypothetical protein Cloal_2534 [Acetivibrio alkalicellulosi]